MKIDKSLFISLVILLLYIATMISVNFYATRKLNSDSLKLELTNGTIQLYSIPNYLGYLVLKKDTCYIIR